MTPNKPNNNNKTIKPEQKRKKGQRFERFVAKEIENEGLGKAGREGNSGAGFRKGDIAKIKLKIKLLLIIASMFFIWFLLIMCYNITEIANLIKE